MATQMMKAIQIHQYGGPEVISYEDVIVPEIKADEVLIKVAATSFNPVDALFRMGALQEIVSQSFPYTPNIDVSGVIEQVGERVTHLKKGDKVFAFLDVSKNGSAAEYVASRAIDVVLAPKTISLSDAAAIPASGLTAWQGLFEHGKLKSSQRVLITAAAGGVGYLAVQLAKWKGAYVLGTAQERSTKILKELGIDEVIHYEQNNLQEQLSEKVDVILNLAPIEQEETDALLLLLNEGGVLVSASTKVNSQLAEELGVRAISMITKRNERQLKQLATLIDEGHLIPFISGRFPLSDLSNVHAKKAEHKTRGKLLILVNSDL